MIAYKRDSKRFDEIDVPLFVENNILYVLIYQSFGNPRIIAYKPSAMSVFMMCKKITLDFIEDKHKQYTIRRIFNYYRTHI